MAYAAEFGIIDKFEKDKDYSLEYESKKYSCIAIDDDNIYGTYKFEKVSYLSPL
ncbi:hypothetical protein [Tissierella sp.]|uniref:hypothetical protein n=1 Tax=Tissierella sp. TaxID=41274 RepID=UPI0030DBB841